MVVCSSSPAVAARCAHVRAGVGCVASQNITDPCLGPAVLDRLEASRAAPDAVADVMGAAPHGDYRQVLSLDRTGGAGAFHGAQVLGLHAEAVGEACVAGGNLLASQEVPAAMCRAFEASPGALGNRLMAALTAAREAGGEAGPVHSAGLLIAWREAWPYADLRIDWTEDDPIDALAAAWAIYAPQADAYVQRALDPTEAPSYGVLGDP